MVVEARVRVRHRGCFTEFLPDGTHVTQIGGDTQHGVSVVHAPTMEEADKVVELMTRSTERVVVVERGPGSVVVRCHCRQDGVIATLLAFGCTILWPTVYAGGTELYNVVAPSRERLEALVDRLRDMGDVRLEKVSDVTADALDVNVPLSDLTSGLTQRQLHVLRAAIEHGYYESPRRVSAERLADSFGVSRSTLQEHLRKAEQRVLERFAGVLSAHPSLFAAADRRPGRPPARRR